MRFLVTAGNTRERIDDVRDWGNIFTGNTGFAIARALAELGPVDLLTSNRQHLAEVAGDEKGLCPIRGHAFTTHVELKSALATLVATANYDAIIMSAAVSDYRPAGAFTVLERSADPSDRSAEVWRVRSVQAGKVKSTHSNIAIYGEPTEKLVDLFRTAWGYRGMLVKFKLEVGLSAAELLAVGERSRLASGADYLVANTLEMVSGPSAGAYLLSGSGHEWVPRGELPARMAAIVVRRP